MASIKFISDGKALVQMDADTVRWMLKSEIFDECNCGERYRAMFDLVIRAGIQFLEAVPFEEDRAEVLECGIREVDARRAMEKELDN